MAYRYIETPPTDWKQFWKYSLIGCAVILPFLLWLHMPSSPAPKDEWYELKLDVWTAAQEKVKSMLLAPSTASFPWAMPEPMLTGVNYTYRVRSYVDAQNVFGVKLRHNFECRVYDHDSFVRVLGCELN